MEFLALMIAIPVFAAIRSQVIHNHRSRATYKTQDAIMAGKDAHEAVSEFHECGDYMSQLLDLKKWTFNQFYPHLI